MKAPYKWDIPKITLAPKKNLSKKEIEQITKEILNRTQLNSDVNQSDFIFLMSYFVNHPNWIDKQGCGIKSIKVALSPYKNRCFILSRNDETQTDISYKACLTPPTKLAEIKKACRNAIKNIIFEFKNNNVVYGQSICEITNEILTKENTHIDHYDLTFADMFNLWIKDKDLDYLHSKINKTIDHNFDTYFIDNEIVNDFILFHNDKCKLRAVTAYANTVLLK